MAQRGDGVTPCDGLAIETGGRDEYRNQPVSMEMTSPPSLTNQPADGKLPECPYCGEKHDYKNEPCDDDVEQASWDDAFPQHGGMDTH